MKLMFVCLTSNFNFMCIKCNKRMPVTEKHWKGMFKPDRPIEPDGNDLIYVYALCMQCFDEIKDERTGHPHETWGAIFEDEITAIVTGKKFPRINAGSTGLSGEELSALKKFLLTGRIE